MDRTARPEQTPDSVGPYEILRELGRGGMGIVFLARKREPVGRTVALKTIKPGMDTGEVITRFEFEQRIHAMMKHPCIAHFYEEGTTESGHPYFTMEYVEGSDIVSFADSRRMAIRDRVDLLRQACEGIHYVNEKGIVHGSLRPSKILVTTFGTRPHVKIIDFGLAEVADPMITMSSCPDQDLPGLGSVLYELLVGVPPIEMTHTRAMGIAKAAQWTRGHRPPPPSERLMGLAGRADEIARARGRTVRSLHEEIQGELDRLTMRAISRTSEPPFRSAADFARSLKGRPKPSKGRWGLLRSIRSG